MTSNGTAPPRPVVTLSTLYGTEEEAIGRRVAERLGVSFLDRDALPSAVAERMNLPKAVVAAHDEQPQGLRDRLTAMLSRAPVISQGPPRERLEAEARRYRAEVERVLARAAASGGVILRRAGTVVLRSVPGVLHVRLTGPRDARVQRVMESESIDKETAERRVDSNDRARTAYCRDFYGVDPSRAQQQTGSAITAIKFSAGVVAAVFILVAIAIMGAYPLTETRFRQLVGDIADRRASSSRAES